MIDTNSLSLKFLEKEPYAGSFRGMRYTFRKEADQLTVILYPEPWCLEKTPPENQQQKAFPFTKEGLQDGISWANAQYEANPEEWNSGR